MTTRNPGSSVPILAGDRAGGSSGKNSLYASFIAAKSFGSARKTVVFTTALMPSPSSSRIDATFRRHWRVWPPASAAAHSPAFPPGTSGVCPEMNTNPFATTQWEYGPSGFGCLGRSGTAFKWKPGEGVRRPSGATMSKRDIVARIGGAAGDGVSSTAESLAKIFARSGLNTWTYSSYQSVIRGGHVWTQVRGGLDPVLSQGVDPDIVMCLNQQTMDVHQGDVVEGGAIVYDLDGTKPDPKKLRKNVRLIGIPLRKKAQTLSPNALMRNTVALGAVVRLFDLDFRHVESAFRDIWGDKKPEIVEQNIQAAKLGAAGVDEAGGSLKYGLAYTNQAKYLMTGNEALCLGALAAGVKFLAQYPMTPASSILHWMAVHGPAHGVVVKQVEDELAAMNMTVGAGFAGVRAMTATSGGGFSLMVEAIGQAGMTETPLVAVLVQRSGPSTGLPTKTEQGDLNLAL